MKFLSKVSLFIIALALAATSFAQDEKKGPQMGAPEEIKNLNDLLGEWDVAMEMKFTPDGEWMPSEGTCVWAELAGGAALSQTFVSTFMGQPYEAFGTLTYNRGSNRWESTWIDNAAAYTSLYIGEKTGEDIVVTGEDEHMGKIMISRITISNITEKSYDWQMETSQDDGASFSVSMRAKYTKK